MASLTRASRADKNRNRTKTAAISIWLGVSFLSASKPLPDLKPTNDQATALIDLKKFLILLYNFKVAIKQVNFRLWGTKF